MNGEFITRFTVWLTIAAYLAGAIAFAISNGRRKWESLTRWAWTLAAVSLLAHMIAAFQYYHGWNHHAAYVETQRQTYQVTGLNWGGGIYINYFLLMGLIADASWWWAAGLESYRRRTKLVTTVWHAFVIFIIFNATVVFKSGVIRWTGAVLSLALAGALFLIARHPQVASRA